VLNRLSFWITLPLCLLGGIACGLAQETERRVFTMGTWLEVHADSPDTAERAIREIERVEKLLSRWQPGSEIARMNAGAELVPCPTVSNALARAAYWERWSDEAFQMRRGETSLLDTDAFAKGAALDHALEKTRKAKGAVTLNFGGQVAVVGRDSATAQPTLAADSTNASVRAGLWAGQLSAPLDRTKASGTARLELCNGSLSTSGNTVKPGHIRDPKTGKPVRRRGQVTVWAPNAFDADCASTACFVLGPERALAKVNATPDLECCFEWIEQDASHGGRNQTVLHRRISKNWNLRTRSP